MYRSRKAGIGPKVVFVACFHLLHSFANFKLQRNLSFLIHKLKLVFYHVESVYIHKNRTHVLGRFEMGRFVLKDNFFEGYQTSQLFLELLLLLDTDCR